MNITRRVTEAVDFEYMKAAIDAGNGPEFVRPFDELIIPIENGKSITAVAAGMWATGGPGSCSRIACRSSTS
jgi:hypothetical protein